MMPRVAQDEERDEHGRATGSNRVRQISGERESQDQKNQADAPYKDPRFDARVVAQFA
jgi:hypothetical protein